MPTSPLEVYFPVLVQAVVGLVIAGALVTIAWLLGYRGVRNRAKDTAYECGVEPTGTAQDRFSVKFYLVAMLFIVFDIEVVFLYPWVVVYRDLRLFAFFEMFLFVAFILAGFFYIWKKGVLDWSKNAAPILKTRQLPPSIQLEPFEPSQPPVPEELIGAGNRH